MRAFQALRMLLEDPPLEPAPTSFTAILERTIASFDEELRLTGMRISLDARDAPIRAAADAGVAVAARIAQAHGGGLDARRTEAGGCVLTLTIRA